MYNVNYILLQEMKIEGSMILCQMLVKVFFDIIFYK
jgi:hypothetical protein